ncbi:MAG: YfcE family phosphodiesterase [Ruminococcaceae bacterium]|nr:YfcE family phosphodiesterase [Oscillospiraceae bacterium]
MENILVLSDIHGGFRRALEVAKTHSHIKTVIYLGDGCRHLDSLQAEMPDAAFVAVRGNCDTCLDGVSETELVLEIEGHRIFICHGHTRMVKSGMGALLRAAKEKNCDIALFGHTHFVHDEYVPDCGIYLFNPGSIGNARDGRYTYGILSLDKKNVLFSIGECE